MIGKPIVLLLVTVTSCSVAQRRLYPSSLQVMGNATMTTMRPVSTTSYSHPKKTVEGHGRRAPPTVTIVGLSKERSSLHGRMLNSAFVKPLSDINKNYGFSFKASHSLLKLNDYSPSAVLECLCNQILTSGVSAVFYIGDDDLSDYKASADSYLLQITNFIGLPVMVWMADKSGAVPAKPDSTVLLMTPSIVHQATAMLAVLDRYNWRAFALVTGSPSADQDYFVDVLRHLAETVHNKEWYEILAVLRLHRVDDDRYLHAEMLKLNKSEARVILLYATQREADRILTKANTLGQTGKDFIWILSKSAITGQSPSFYPGLIGFDYDTEQPARDRSIKTGLLLWAQAIDRMMTSQSTPTLIETRIRKRSALQSSGGDLQNWSRLSLSNVGCLDGIQHRWVDGERLVRHMKNISVTVDGETLAFEEDGKMKHTVLNVTNMDRNRKWVKIGQWSSTDGLQIGDITWPGSEPTPPKGRPARYHLRVVTLQEKPYVVYSDPDAQLGTCPPQSVLCRMALANITRQYTNATTNPQLYQCCSGLCIDLLKMLGEKIGFDFELFEVPDRKWGVYDKSAGEWNGLIKSILDGEADMIVTALQITPERTDIIDFSVPYLETGISILVAVRDGVISPTAFLEPYDYASWCLILLFSVHASGAAMFIVEWLSPQGLDRGNKPLREHKFSLFRAFWLIWSMLFGAAVSVDSPRGVSSRFLACVWALFAVVFTASYTANLAAFMITKQDYDRITGIKDPVLSNPKAHKPPFKFGTVPHGSTETNLMKNFPKVHDYMKAYNKSTAIEGIKAVKDGELNAFIYDATVLEYLASHDDGCKLKTVGSWFASTGYGIGFPKESRWIPVIDKFMIQFQHDGEMERLQKFWMAGACKKNDAKGEASKPLEVLNFTSAFILLACGMLLGSILLLFEHIYFTFFRGRLRKCDTVGCCTLVSLSLGKSLTFQQSVREAIEMTKTFKCRNPICETQVWKVKHELDMAQLHITRLQHIMAINGLSENMTSVKKIPKLKAGEHTSTAVTLYKDDDDVTASAVPPRHSVTTKPRKEQHQLLSVSFDRKPAMSETSFQPITEEDNTGNKYNGHVTNFSVNPPDYDTSELSISSRSKPTPLALPDDAAEHHEDDDDGCYGGTKVRANRCERRRMLSASNDENTSSLTSDQRAGRRRSAPAINNRKCFSLSRTPYEPVSSQPGSNERRQCGGSDDAAFCESLLQRRDEVESCSSSPTQRHTLRASRDKDIDASSTFSEDMAAIRRLMSGRASSSGSNWSHSPTTSRHKVEVQRSDSVVEIETTL